MKALHCLKSDFSLFNARFVYGTEDLPHFSLKDPTDGKNEIKNTSKADNEEEGEFKVDEKAREAKAVSKAEAKKEEGKAELARSMANLEYALTHSDGKPEVKVSKKSQEKFAEMMKKDSQKTPDELTKDMIAAFDAKAAIDAKIAVAKAQPKKRPNTKGPSAIAKK